MLQAYSPVSYLRQTGGPGPVPPLLIARAGRDGLPGVNASIDEFVSEALAHNLAFELHNHPEGEHGFDILTDDERSRAIVRRTLAFFQDHLR
jgi:acetyl esterase/lipase